MFVRRPLVVRGVVSPLRAPWPFEGFSSGTPVGGFTLIRLERP
jgi:hypothetical protein